MTTRSDQMLWRVVVTNGVRASVFAGSNLAARKEVAARYHGMGLEVKECIPPGSYDYDGRASTDSVSRYWP